LYTVRTGTLTKTGMNISNVQVIMKQITVEEYCTTSSKFYD